jgi:hypothetical protein
MAAPKRFNCGATMETAAKAECKDAPYQVFRYRDTPGSTCGAALLAIGCHVEK